MNVVYSVFESADLTDLAEVLGESFSSGEPMARAVGLTDADVRKIAVAFGPKALSERLTVVARLENGSMVGALLAQDLVTAPPEGLESVTKRFLPIGALLDGLDEQYRQGKQIEPGKYLHMFMLGVRPALEGQGIGRQLVSAALANGRDLGFQTAVTEATGNGSQHIFRTLGFVERVRERYANFLYEGVPVFRSIATPAGTVLMDREVGLANSF